MDKIRILYKTGVEKEEVMKDKQAVVINTKDMEDKPDFLNQNVQLIKPSTVNSLSTQVKTDNSAVIANLIEENKRLHLQSEQLDLEIEVNRHLKEEIETLRKEKEEKCESAFVAGCDHTVYSLQGGKEFPNWEEWKLNNLKSDNP